MNSKSTKFSTEDEVFKDKTNFANITRIPVIVEIMPTKDLLLFFWLEASIVLKSLRL